MLSSLRSVQKTLKGREFLVGTVGTVILVKITSKKKNNFFVIEKKETYELQTCINKVRHTLKKKIPIEGEWFGLINFYTTKRAKVTLT